MDLDTRMKEFYEFPTRYVLPRRTHTVIRLDGKNFHNFTKACTRPFDEDLLRAFDDTMMHLCQNIQGAQIGYTQSDEISILLTDFEKLNTEPWLGATIQKMTSISASMATAFFNVSYQHPEGQLATFDSRVFTIPSAVEVENYFIWRQKDAIRNAINMVASEIFSPWHLHGLSTNDRQALLLRNADVDVTDLPLRQRRGSIAYKETRHEKKRFFHKKKQVWEETPEPVEYTQWVMDAEIPVLTENTEYFRKISNLLGR